MASVPDWSSEGYTFQGASPAAGRREGGLSVRGGVRWFTQALRRFFGRSDEAAPAPKSLIYVLCEEYRHLDLWAAYSAFRLDPRASNWEKLRRRNVPWQSEQTVEGLVTLLHPWNGKRTPDPNTVGQALVTAPSSSAAPSRKKR